MPAAPGFGRRSFALFAAALTLALTHSGDASARKFRMSGDWVMRMGGVFLPLQFAATAMGTGGGTTHVSMGNLTGAFDFPNGPVPVSARASATGSAPAALRIPARRVDASFMAFIPIGGITLNQITTRIGVSGPTATATLAKNGGPGSFTWCPGDAGCAAGGGMLATDPPQGAGTRNGRVLYRAGANRFGGVMRMALAGHASWNHVFDITPFRARNTDVGPFGLQPVGGSYAELRIIDLPPVIVTQPLTYMNGAGILNPGPKVTTMLGLTNTDTGATLTFPGRHYTQTGFPWTTGTVFAQQTAGSGGDDFFSVMGTDARSALGAGAVSLVAGGLTLASGGYDAPGATPAASFQRLRVTLSSPVPSLSPAGFAAAGALVLLGAGYAMRRRRG